MKNNQCSPAMYPCWYDGKYVNEIEFTRVFLERHPMRCTNGILYSLDGVQLDESLIRKQITEMLQEVITSSLPSSHSMRFSSIFRASMLDEFVTRFSPWKETASCFTHGGTSPKRQCPFGSGKP